jgi:hypothetical protein
MARFLDGEWCIQPDADHSAAEIAIVGPPDSDDGERHHIVSFQSFPGRQYRLVPGDNGRWSVNGWQVQRISPDKNVLLLSKRGCVDAVWHRTSCAWMQGDWIIEPDDDVQREVEMHVEILGDGGRLRTTFSDFPDSHYTGGLFPGPNEEPRLTVNTASGAYVVFVHPSLTTFVSRGGGRADTRYRRKASEVDGAAAGTTGPEAECCICQDSSPLSQGIFCGEAGAAAAEGGGGGEGGAAERHFTCNDCLTQHANFELRLSAGALVGIPGIIRCPGMRGGQRDAMQDTVGARRGCPCRLGGAKNVGETLQLLATRVPPDTFARIVQTDQTRVRLEQLELTQRRLGTALAGGSGGGEGGNAVARQLVDALLTGEQQRESFLLPDGTFAAYQCGAAACGFGPVVHGHCSNLRSHDGQQVGLSVHPSVLRTARSSSPSHVPRPCRCWPARLV